MKRRVITCLAMIVTLAMAGFGLSSSASAQPDPEVVAEDLTTILDNAPGAGATVVGGVQDTVDEFIETQSTVSAFDVALAAAIAAGSELVAGTEQFESLPLGLLLLGFVAQAAVNPYLEAADDPACLLDALDDPTVACDVFDLEDVGQILRNVPDVPQALWEGTPFAFDTGLQDGATELLQGNLIGDPPLFISPSGVGSSYWGVVAALDTLLDGTSYGVGGGNLAGGLGITGLVLFGVTGETLGEIETELAPVFEGAEPATAPLVELLEGISL